MSELEGKGEKKDMATGSGKKTYIKPEVRYERVFETMALSCGKIGSTQRNCRIVRKSS